MRHGQPYKLACGNHELSSSDPAAIYQTINSVNLSSSEPGSRLKQLQLSAPLPGLQGLEGRAVVLTDLPGLGSTSDRDKKVCCCVPVPAAAALMCRRLCKWVTLASNISA